jgi:hypothetical protein
LKLEDVVEHLFEFFNDYIPTIVGLGWRLANFLHIFSQDGLHPRDHCARDWHS